MEKCKWEFGKKEDGVWSTDCGNMHIFEGGSLEENSYKYCPYCGKPIIDAGIEALMNIEELWE